MQTTSRVKKLGEQILLIHFSKGSGLRDLRKSDSNVELLICKGYHWVTVISQESWRVYSFPFITVTCQCWQLLPKTKHKYVSLLRRACLSCFGKTSQGCVLKEKSQGEHFLLVMIFTGPLSLTEKMHCRVGEQQVINTACGCGVGCLVGASKNKYF